MKDVQMKNEGLGKFVDCGKKVVPVPEFRETVVNFNLEGGLFSAYLQQLHDNLGACQGAEVPPLLDLRDLLLALLILRVEYVRNIRLPFSIIGTKFCIPAFFSQILTNIGRVESDEFGIILVPHLDLCLTKKVKLENGQVQEKKLTLDEVAEKAFSLSRKFRPFFEVSGVTYATELPRSKEGNISLMTLQVVDGCVKAESNKNEPIFALMAAVLCNVLAKEVVLPRLNYGGLQYLRTLVTQVGDYERTSS